MIGIDTNILTRFFVQDDPQQSARVDSFLHKLTPNNPGFISSVVLVELAWVLRGRYGVSRSDLIEYFKQLLESPELFIENEAALTQTIIRFASPGTDFADCFIERIASFAGCSHTVTFDARATKAPGMSPL